jgi:putative PIN family toxin of toxin-antitoxin system
MRIVLDSNVLARAARPFLGPAREVLLRCTEEPHILLLSAFIVSELRRVLRYERVRKMHGLDDVGIERYVADVESAALIVALPETSQEAIVAHDPKDDPIVHTAVAGSAEFLCTRDRHLHHAAVTAYCRARGIEVLDDVALLARLRASEQRES